jgi:hypothetical protein
MFWDEHNPPHFHVDYGGEKASIDIKNLKLINGNLSRRALNLVLDWAEMYQEELLEDWKLCELRQLPKKIKPLK